MNDAGRCCVATHIMANQSRPIVKRRPHYREHQKCNLWPSQLQEAP
jgi:hypothetical protein